MLSGAGHGVKHTADRLGNGVCRDWVLTPLSNSWIITILWLCIALNRTPNIDCYWVGAIPNVGTITCDYGGPPI